MSDIYDSAFRTEINDCPQFILPFLNEVFGENYSGDEKIVFHPNEHFIEKKDKNDQERITDTNFTVCGTEMKEYHLECESSKYSSKLMVRIFEYDAQIALDHRNIEGNSIRLSFPNTAVLCLRGSRNTPDKMNIIIEVPGSSISYEVPLIQMKNYTAKMIFEKKLYLLIPFYIFNFERKLNKCNKDDKELKELQKEFQYISDKLKMLEESGEITSYDKRIMQELSKKVIEFHARNYKKVKKGIGDIMCGPMIETEVDRLVRAERDKAAKAQEEAEKALAEVEASQLQNITSMLNDNLPDDLIIKYTGVTLEKLQGIKDKIHGVK